MTIADVIARIYNSFRDTDYIFQPGLGVYYIRKRIGEAFLAKLYIEEYHSSRYQYAFTITIKNNDEQTKYKFILAVIDSNLTLYRDIPLLF